MTLPPLPPSPPFGPPRGAYFSWRKLRQPLPPSPPRTKIVTRSTNMEAFSSGGVGSRRAVKRSGLCRGLGGGDDVDPAPFLVEHDLAVDQREDRPVASDADVLARPPPRALLTADDAPGLGDLAAEELDSQHLGVRIAPVAARSLTFFVSHDRGVLSTRF